MEFRRWVVIHTGKQPLLDSPSDPTPSCRLRTHGALGMRWRVASLPCRWYFRISLHGAGWRRAWSEGSSSPPGAAASNATHLHIATRAASRCCTRSAPPPLPPCPHSLQRSHARPPAVRAHGALHGARRAGPVAGLPPASAWTSRRLLGLRLEDGAPLGLLEPRREAHLLAGRALLAHRCAWPAHGARGRPRVGRRRWVHGKNARRAKIPCDWAAQPASSCRIYRPRERWQRGARASGSK